MRRCLYSNATDDARFCSDDFSASRLDAMNPTGDDHNDSMAVDIPASSAVVEQAAEQMMDIAGFLEKYVIDAEDLDLLRRALVEAQRNCSTRPRKYIPTICMNMLKLLGTVLTALDPPLGNIPEDPAWLRAIGDFGPDRTFGAWATEAESIQLRDIEKAMDNAPLIIEAILIEAVSIHVQASYSGESRKQEAVHQDFSREYKGDAVDRLRQALREQNITHNDPAATMYAPVLVLLQSSGSGKTRAAVQLCSKELGLVACVRTRIKDVVTSAPPPDEAVYEALVKNMLPGETEETATLYVGAWLVAYLAEFLGLCKREISIVTAGQGIRSSGDWSAFVEHIARLLTDGIVQDFVTVPARSSPRSDGSLSSRAASDGKGKQAVKTHSRRSEFFTAVSVLAQSEVTAHSSTITSSLTQGASASSILDPKEMAEAFATKMAVSLDGLKQLRKGQEGIVFLALDEAMSLGTRRLSVLRRLTSHFKEADFWVILLDTNHKISELTGHKAQVPSSRLMASSSTRMNLAEPFVTLPHDIFLRTDEAWLGCLFGESQITHADCLQMLPKMGRPLWNDASWRSITDKNGYCVDGIPLKMILQKLIGIHSVKFIREPEGRESRLLALASQRVPLNLIAMQGTVTPEGPLRSFDDNSRVSRRVQ